MGSMEFDPKDNMDLKTYLNEYEADRVKNLDLLFKNLHYLQEVLFLKKEQAEQAGDEKTLAYIEGQIAGYKYAVSIVNAFFDN
jgi:hypothetical protein